MMNFKIAVAMSFFIISSVFSATLNMNDEDYNTLMKLLAEQELEDQKRDETSAYAENIIDGNNQYLEDVPSNQQEKFVNVGVDGEVNTLTSALSSGLSLQKPSFSALIGAPTEVLGLVQTFLELKAQVMEKIHALILDNFDVIKNVYRVFATKLRHLHSFTLKGVWVLRKILEFALQMFGMWEVNKPSLMVDFGIDKLINAGLGASVGYNN